MQLRTLHSIQDARNIWSSSNGIEPFADRYLLNNVHRRTIVAGCFTTESPGAKLPDVRSRVIERAAVRFLPSGNFFPALILELC